ncbi:MAG: 5'/3'-nucleotidase SurE [Chlamydiia bacterium]|nr:5'/3'-nucleotidase SurE [Chlamydiia bacterium]
MHILITNDDGIDAVGLKFLIEAMRPLGNISIAAPATEQSGVGVAFTPFAPIKVIKHSFPCSTPAFKVHGTPADCVSYMLHMDHIEKPDLIVSGINRGANTGRYVLSSGTVGAVIEGLFANIPGIAFSCMNYHEPNYALFVEHARAIAQHVIEHPLPEHTLLNVNFPQNAPKGYRFARQGGGHWSKRAVQVDEDTYILEGAPLYEGEHPDGEVSLLREGFITAAPIRVFNLTHHAHLDEHKSIFESKFNVN